MNMKQLMGKVKFEVIRKSPELLLGGALVTGVACVATTVSATTKAQDIKAKINDHKNDICLLAESGASDDLVKKATIQLYKEIVVEYSKKYAIPAGLFLATSGLVFASYKIQKNRQVALSTALASATMAYSSLYAKLQRGASAGLTAQEILDGVDVEAVVNEETGEVTYEKTQTDPIQPIYNFRFDRYSTAWEPDPYQNQLTLNGEMQWANDRLQIDGYLFLNDVLERLGLPRTKAGQIVGWRLNGDGDGFVDFGIVDCSKIEGCGYDANAFDLSFNIDGDILTHFGN